MAWFDGHYYESEADFPDMGSIICTDFEELTHDYNPVLFVRNYQGLSIDEDKLPHYDDLATGSSFLAVDTMKVYFYEKTSDKWYKS